jgi:hypothetical protein
LLLRLGLGLLLVGRRPRIEGRHLLKEVRNGPLLLLVLLVLVLLLCLQLSLCPRLLLVGKTLVIKPQRLFDMSSSLGTATAAAATSNLVKLLVPSIADCKESAGWS